MSEVEVELRDRILEAIQFKRWPEADELWLRIVEGVPFAFHHHEQVIRRLLKKKHTQKLRDLYTVYLDSKLKHGDAAFVLQLIELMLSLEGTLDFLRQPLIAALREQHKERDQARLEEFLRVSGLATDAPDLKKALGRFEELLGATKGQVFKHQKWGLGVVRDLDTAANKVVIDFELNKNKEMTLEGVRQFLERVPKDHVLAKMATGPVELKELAFDEPAQIIRLTLRSYGGSMKAGDMKRVLTTRFLTEDEYRKWWNSAREAIKLDPHIDMNGTGVHATLVYRSEPRSFIDAVLSSVKSPKTPDELRNALRDVSLHGDEAELSEEDRAKLLATFCEPITTGRLGNVDKLHRALCFEEFSDIFGEGVANPIDLASVLFVGHFSDVMESIRQSDLRRVALERAKELRPEEWPAMFMEGFIHLDGRTAAWAEKEMSRNGHFEQRQHAIESVLSHPDANPDAFLWAVRNVLDGTWNLADALARPILLVEEVLSLLDEAYDKSIDELGGPKVAEAKSMVGRLRSFLQEGQGKQMRKVVQGATPEEARKLLTRIQLHSALAGPFKENMERIIFTEHPALRKVTKQEEEEERKKPQYHYALPETIDRKRQELSHILNVEVPLTAQAIAAARELGDLRENAEYHAAKDRQKLFMQKAAELEDLIARARMIELDKIQTTQSRFGTRLRVVRTTDSAEMEYTILGMWEADLRANIISYMTPFGSQLLNRSVGDVFVVTLPDGRREEYRLESIERAAVPAATT